MSAATRKRKDVFELIQDARNVGDVSRFIALTKRWLKKYKRVNNREQVNHRVLVDTLNQLKQEDEIERSGL